MNGFKTFLTATFLSAAMLFSTAAQAMEIRQFDKMADQDQSDYIGDLIRQGAEKVLTDEGRSGSCCTGQASFYYKNPPGDADTLGMVEFETNLALARVNDAKHAAEHPNDPRLEVEDAMFVTLEQNHIELPDAFFTVASNFHPKFPPPDKEKKKKKS